MFIHRDFTGRKQFIIAFAHLLIPSAKMLNTLFSYSLKDVVTPV